jgi:hypothetical protein
MKRTAISLTIAGLAWAGPSVQVSAADAPAPTAASGPGALQCRGRFFGPVDRSRNGWISPRLGNTLHRSGDEACARADSATLSLAMGERSICGIF